VEKCLPVADGERQIRVLGGPLHRDAVRMNEEESRAAAPTSRSGVSSAALRTDESSRASDPRTARSDKSSDELATEKLRSFEAPSVADGEEIGVDQKGRREVRFFARECPEATP
jgi:hypothetical protein